jgi:hypothetical protein
MPSNLNPTTNETPRIAVFGDMTEVDLVESFSAYQKCVRHFLLEAQYSALAQSLATLMNILLPYQRSLEPGSQFLRLDTDNEPKDRLNLQLVPDSVSLIPYVRRLIVTATDTPTVMQGFFGKDWVAGVGLLHSQERINYLFTAKSGGWLRTKAHYDILPYETVPFMRPLRDPQRQELQAADTRWSQWLAMEDWMVGPNSPFEDM